VRLPIGAAFRHEGAWAAYAVEAGRARLVPVTVGARSDAEMEVLAGIAEGAAVVVHPGESVRPGASVRPR